MSGGNDGNTPRSNQQGSAESSEGGVTLASPVTRAHPAAAERIYDVVIVGAGVAGAILAKELAGAGKTVLLLEAGRATSIRPEGYASYVETFYEALAKTPNSPFPQNPAAASSSVLFQQRPREGVPVTTGYQVYKYRKPCQGPSESGLPFLSTFTRALGGTTLHFLGTCIRMLPEDFHLATLFGHGIDWPFGFETLEPFYEKGELEMGTAADVAMQEREGTKFRPGYQYPMRQIPPSYFDRWLEDRIRGMTFKMGNESFPVEVVGTPAGRNGMPNPGYRYPKEHPLAGQPYQPIGSPYDTRRGQRCEGNSNCVPICPVMAKYNALRTLYTLQPKTSRNLEIITQAVASQIELAEDGKVSGIVCKLYDVETGSQYVKFTARGQVYVVAAHAIESAKLLLASGAANSSDMVGRNLMDHPYLLTWGLAPKGARLGVNRGPQITSELPMRHGSFRKDFAAFRADIRNRGWDFAKGSPYWDVGMLVNDEQRFGLSLRDELRDRVQRQISFGFQIEQLPDPDNRVEIDDKYRDALGNHRPILSYDVSEYTRKAMRVARDLSRSVIEHVGGKDHTEYPKRPKEAVGYIDVGGEPFEIHGSGHIMGTHRMGLRRSDSVVNPDQRTWDHRNLFLVGCGNMPTVGTSNPTLTVAALAFKAAKAIKKQLES